MQKKSSSSSIHISPIIFHGKDAHSCGYCKTLDEESDRYMRTPDTSVSIGFHVYQVPSNIYEQMMYRNMRRCGDYYYQPVNNETCCPQYAIRLNTLEFKMNKKQSKVLKRMKKYLETGVVHHQNDDDNQEQVSGHDTKKRKVDENDHKLLGQLSESLQSLLKDNIEKFIKFFDGVVNQEELRQQLTELFQKQTFQKSQRSSNTFSCGIAFALFGLSKKLKCNTVCDKKDFGSEVASILLQSNWEQTFDVNIQVENNGYINVTLKHPSTENASSKGKREQSKQAQSSQPQSAQPKTLTTVLLDSSYRAEEYKVYQKYQKTIHKEETTEKGYERFLCKSSLLDMDTQSSSPEKPLKGYGTFHLQYRIDDQLVAVSVLDVLPTGLSSVYFFYDPDYSHLSLGVYSVLNEIEMLQKESIKFPQFKYMYLGFYIHSCKKMRYKGEYYPSELLCNETFTWVPLDKSLSSKLDQHKYFKFNEQAETVRNVDFPETNGLYLFVSGQILPFTLGTSILPLTKSALQKINLFKRTFGKQLALESGFAYYVGEEDLEDGDEEDDEDEE
ncbi:hypothetical protein FDP41_009344 [Naegleria fowleri]|uniref:Arginyl-tRNA--protein transferase 1 n=1 Tax=Naegleria fowleri TaxID=5763 RepID=A0A6A5BCQ6_NAEFO|nr:uncharacterized protein FDP41_009344 [Naegleria fowleri]KAF0972441.1 hypothetical protein FDP41_009344 [Naegleria fowleri]CAG4715407.1 unnamed protein product [Naegleria fowleri]